MLRLLALFVAPAAALSGETVVDMATTAMRLSRRALQNLPSPSGVQIPGTMPPMADAAGIGAGLAGMGMASMSPAVFMQQQRQQMCRSPEDKVRLRRIRDRRRASGPGSCGCLIPASGPASVPPRPLPRATSGRPALHQAAFKQWLNEQLTDPSLGFFSADAASLPNAQLVECLCQSSWDFSDPAFTRFAAMIALSVSDASPPQPEPAAILDLLEQILQGRRSEASAWPPAWPSLTWPSLAWPGLTWPGRPAPPRPRASTPHAPHPAPRTPHPVGPLVRP